MNRETLHPTNTFRSKIFYLFEPAINSTAVECLGVHSDKSWIIKTDAAIDWTVNPSRPSDKTYASVY